MIRVTLQLTYARDRQAFLVDRSYWPSYKISSCSMLDASVRSLCLQWPISFSRTNFQRSEMSVLLRLKSAGRGEALAHTSFPHGHDGLRMDCSWSSRTLVMQAATNKQPALLWENCRPFHTPVRRLQSQPIGIYEDNCEWYK